MNRRKFLATVAASGSAVVAGCSSGTDVQVTNTPSQSVPQPVLGDPESDVTVQAFEDYMCPHCRDYSLNVFPDLKEEFIDTGDVRYEFWDFPIPVSERFSYSVAEVGRSVQMRVGNDAYWDFSKEAFSIQTEIESDEDVVDIAERVGADRKQTVQDLKTHRYRPTVKRNRSRGTELGVNGTPTVFVDGVPVDGNDYTSIAQRIQQSL